MCKFISAGIVFGSSVWLLFGCPMIGRFLRQQTTARLAQLIHAERQQDYRLQIVEFRRDSNSFYLASVDTLSNSERVMALQIEQVTVVSTLSLRSRSSCWERAAASSLHRFYIRKGRKRGLISCFGRTFLAPARTRLLAKREVSLGLRPGQCGG